MLISYGASIRKDRIEQFFNGNTKKADLGRPADFPSAENTAKVFLDALALVPFAQINSIPVKISKSDPLM